MNPSRPDVVFDCNVFLQAIARPGGPAAQALRFVEQSVITLHTSKETLRELRRALAYPEMRDRNPNLNDDIVNAFLARVTFRAALARNVPAVFSFSRDPSDEPYINLSIATAADFLVTRDKDLLSLATGYSKEAKQLRQRIPNLHILKPEQFIDEIEKRRSRG